VTGYRVGYLCAAPAVIDETLKVQDTAVVCAPRPGQLAVRAGLVWDGLDDWLAARRAETDGRVRAFADALAGAAGPFTLESAGAFFAYLRHDPALVDAVTTGGRPPADPRGTMPAAWRVADRLARDCGVIALPGAPFGRHEIDALRVSVGNARPDRLREAARRMQAWGQDAGGRIPG